MVLLGAAHYDRGTDVVVGSRICSGEIDRSMISGNSRAFEDAGDGAR
jgi:hypothetical protein